jgi:NADPH:quinone reductase-like Zn-dependent oxidoreductase
MKAVIYSKYGTPDVLELKEIEKPIPKDNEILIKVYASTVNRTDCGILRASPFFLRYFTGLYRPSNQIPGTEFAGEVEAIGKKVSTYKAGDKVFGFDWIGLRAHAEYMVISQDKALTKMPEKISFEQAAASIEGAHYAYSSISRVGIKSDQKVLVYGASGAIGSAAVQIAKYLGACVTAVCNSKNVEIVKSLGADKVIDYTKEDFTKEDQKYNFIFDAVGKSSFNKCRPLLYPDGIYISSDLGYMAQNIFFALITPIIGRKKAILPSPIDEKISLLFIKKLIEAGKFKTLIDRKYPLEQIAEAYKYVETGQKTGNVVITVKHNSK